MTKIIDFGDAELSARHGSYAGRSAKKDGILFHNEMWIIKYTASVPEYIASHTYQILGIDAQETRLGIRRGRLVVACQDFCGIGERLFEMGSIRNAAYRELSDRIGDALRYAPAAGCVDLNEILLQFNYNPLLLRVPGMEEHFWNMAVIDIFMDNNSRDLGNWGLIHDENTGAFRIAPVYGNSRAFCSNPNNEHLTGYSLDGHRLSADELLQIDLPGLKNAILQNVPRMESRMETICDFIRQIPEETETRLPVCSQAQKDSYIDGLRGRLDCILLPAYKKISLEMCKKRAT
jgi:hypothetical protein